MNFNNNGDEIKLIDPTGQVKHTLSYSSTREGVTIEISN
jgi:hypothetical protein